MWALLRDVRIGLRVLARSPRFTLGSIALLALGMGVAGAVFNLFDSVLLQPPPVAEPDRLVAIFTGDEEQPWGTSSYPDYRDLAELPDVLSGLAAYSTDHFVTFGTETATDRVTVNLVTGNYFQVLGIPAAEGRMLQTSDDTVPGAHSVAVLSWDLRQRRFAGGAVGRTLRLNGRVYTVVGVAPEGFHGVRADLAPELWLPMMQQSEVTPARWGDLLGDRGARWLEMVGRLRPGVNPAGAEAAVTTLGRALEQEYSGSNDRRGFSLLPMATARVVPSELRGLQRFLTLVMAVALTVLFITCLNVGNLMLVRAILRQKEFSLRLALGGGRGQLARQLVVEAVLLALTSSAASLLLVFGLVRLLGRLDLANAIDLPLSNIELGVDGRLLLFNLAVSLTVGLLLGLVPVIQSWRQDLVTPLKEQVGMQSHRRSRVRGAFVIAEVALSCVLLVAALLFIRTLLNLRQVDPGFRLDDVLVASLDLGLGEYEPAAGVGFYEELLRRVEELPEVRGATLAGHVPVDPHGSRAVAVLPGQVAEDPDDGLAIDVNSVAPGYFETLGIPLVEGRGFGLEDRLESQPVAVVNETLARLLWPDREALGKRLSTSGPAGPYLQVVGVAADSFYRSLREDPTPYLYQPIAQRFEPAVELVAWTRGAPTAAAPGIREAVRRLDPDVPVFGVRSLREHMAEAMARERLLTWLLVAVGLLTLVLAAVGLYGVISYLVAQRTREIGIRRALGASSGDILSLVLRHNLVLVAAGLGLGLLAAFFTVRTLASLLFGIDPQDPLSFAAVLLLLGGVALIASWLPARRAVSLEPTAALRKD